MAVAVLGAIVISTFTTHLNDVISTSSLTQIEQEQILIQSDKLGGIIIPDTFDETTRLLARNAIRESFIFGFRRAMGICTALALIGALVSFVIIHNPPRPTPSLDSRPT